MITSSTFTGDGSTTVFLLTVAVTTPQNVYVTVDGVSQLSSAYSVSGTSLTFSAAPIAGAKIEARYGTSEDQNVSNFIADGTETEFLLASTPSSRAGAFVSIDGVMQRVEGYSISGSTLSFPTAPPAGAEIEVRFGFDALEVGNSFDGDGSTVTFDMEFTADADGRVIVLIDGVFQHTGAYSVSGRYLTLAAAPPTGAKIEVRRLETPSPPFRGACVQASGVILPNGVVIWSLFGYDTDGFWSSASASRLTVPPRARRCRVYGQATHGGDGTGSGQLSMGIKKNGSLAYDGVSRQALDVADLGVVNALNAQTPALAVSEGDYFELDLAASDGTWDHGSTWFAIDVIE